MIYDAARRYVDLLNEAGLPACVEELFDLSGPKGNITRAQVIFQDNNRTRRVILDQFYKPDKVCYIDPFVGVDFFCPHGSIRAIQEHIKNRKSS